MKVLIVDDEALQLEVLGKLVRAWGHSTVQAINGKQALERTERNSFDLFMLDVFLPDMTAIELIPRIKAMQPGARIITLTGQSSRELERRLRELGISYYMAKPFQRAELESILSHLSGRAASQYRPRTETDDREGTAHGK
jgi:CheY-like chemotaxis protein